VVYDPRFNAVSDFFPLEDADSQERRGLDDVIETLEKKQLRIADRKFCTLKFKVVLLTNLPRDKADAVAVSKLYRTRWKIETALRHMTVAMNCEIKPLCYSKAALFCFASALMAYNAFAVMKAAIASEHGRQEAELLSHDYVALEIAEATDGMLIALPNERWEEMESISTADFAAEVRTIVGGIDMTRDRKHIRGPQKPPPKRTNNRDSVHCSTKRILDKRSENAC